MSTTIDHFMWGYQQHFRVWQETIAKGLFGAIDDRFAPEIFLVGVLVNPNPGRHSSCVEPEDDFWILSEDFSEVAKRAASLEDRYPEGRLEHSLEIAAEWHRHWLTKRAIRDAILAVIGESSARPEGMRYFSSMPEAVGDYLVAVVLGLQGGVLDSYPCLSADSVPLHEYRMFPAPASLLRAATEEYLSQAEDRLRQPDPGLDPMGGRETEELLRAAGDRLMRGIAFRADPHEIGGWYGLFRSCNTISSLKYEAEAGSGKIIVAREKHPNVQSRLAFVEPVAITRYRAARKLLELAANELALHSNSGKIFGLVSLDDYDGIAEDLFEIRFVGHHHWELWHDRHPLMRVAYGVPALPRLPFDESKLRQDLARLFTRSVSLDVERLTMLVRQAERARKGASLVIAEQAASEARRLGAQATCIHPLLLTADLVAGLTSIDGAILVAPDGTCHAIGVILDGMASDKGDPGRGARYNSAVRYVESQEAPCMVVVVSEDGGVDFVPNLRPPVSRGAVEAKLTELKEIAEAEKVSWRRYRSTIEWLESKRFYLLSEHCSAVNHYVSLLDERLREERPQAPRIVRAEFVPHEEMRADLYYDD